MEMWIHNLACGDVVEPGDPQERCGGSTIQHMEIWWIHSLACGDVVAPADVVDIQSSIWRCGESTIWHMEMCWHLEMLLIHN